MRIGIVSEWFARGAAYVSDQYRHTLEADGNKVYVYARGDNVNRKDSRWAGGTENVWNGTPCRVGIPKGIFRWDFQTWIREKKLDWIIFNEQHWIEPVIWARQLGVRTAAYVDYYRVDTLGDFAAYDVLFCHTQRHKSAFHWHPGAHFVRWGTNTKIFMPRNPTESRPFTFFHSCGWSPERKGTREALEAWLLVPGDSNFVIHSQKPLDHILRLLDPQPLNKALSAGRLQMIIGTVEPPGLYHRGDFYVYPTHLEGIGLTQYEALACGLPVIVPDDGPMNEVASDNYSKLLPVERRLPRDDGYYWMENRVSVDSLVEAMVASEQQWQGHDVVSKHVREVAVREFDWEKNSRNITSLLTDADSIHWPPTINPLKRGFLKNTRSSGRSLLGRFIAEISVKT